MVRVWRGLAALAIATCVARAQYLLGLGIGDITGPVVETNMMGYGDISQVDTGLHMRQRSRVYIIAEAENSTNRILFINADICMGDTGVRRAIVSGLESLYDGLYNNENIALVGTHQHSGVAGYPENVLLQVTSLGYVPQTAEAIVNGTILAAQRAHNSLAEGSLSLGNTTIVDGNINRSPSAYLANPLEERALYEYNQDKEMTLLRFDDADGDARGFLAFYAVHGTSLYNNNTLISADNKGMAEWMYESLVDPTAMPGNASFFAGFVQANVGDTSPNTLGAFCESPGESYDGMPCAFNSSTCGGRNEQCHGRGPGFRISDFESSRIIGELQFNGAQTIMNADNRTSVTGSVRSVHTYMLMDNHTFTLDNGTEVMTCPAALGYSFAAGTTDGPGAFDFVQGDNSSDPQNPFWQVVKGFVTPYPSEAQAACQYPKPVLLNTGYADEPYYWSPHTVDIQMLRVGNFVMLVMPGELTTMAGRRMRDTLRSALISNGILEDDAYVVIAGPANTYAHYVTTREEYAVQRYEGASTIFGQYTLEAYMNKYSSLVSYLADNASGTPASDPAPPDLTAEALSFQLPVVYDGTPAFKSFGDVLDDVDESYAPGNTLSVTFVAADPRNNLRLEQTFLTVDQAVDGDWVTVRTDSHPSTTFQWERLSTILGTSSVNISWAIESGTEAGTYRVAYYGDSKSILGDITPFTGYSSNFTISY
ncbi:Neutral/alkaline nonlysosomal ceramidase [Fistulina hepatica ATCC 64428]|uniref:Neutral ceramidase n=1 Tax=Fistulina hepatica ATCC 64428 TaxID=1128425 RepID=A0A0D7ALB8_9AGAR|nr:Neutral/alkaline nonlysosomal ceramidase [Fistulina hepatica ATCC 64428]